MDDLPDYELRKSAGEQPEPAPPPRAACRAASWIAIAVLVDRGRHRRGRRLRPASGSTFARRVRRPRPQPPAPAPAAPEAALGGQAEPIELPPLDQTDALVRRLVGALSSNPRVAAWLATDGLVRNFTVVVENLAAGRTPGRLLARAQAARGRSASSSAAAP